MNAWGLRVGIGMAGIMGMVMLAELTLVNVGGNVPALAPLDLTPVQNPAPVSPAIAGETILSRPLFLPGRRMRGGDMAKAADDTLPRLTGIVIAPGRKVAVFQAEGEKARALSEGDGIGNWTIKKIDRREVTVQNSGGSMTIVPAKDNTRTAAGAGVAPPGPGPAAPRQPVSMPPGAPAMPGTAVQP